MSFQPGFCVSSGFISISFKGIVVACQKGGIVESYRFGKEKGGQVYETEYSCMVNEPVCLTPFINNF